MTDPERLCLTILNSHPDMERIFTQGCCYQFHLILRSVFPNAEAWYDQIEGHVYTRIGRNFYDIRGKHVKLGPTAARLDHKSGDRPHRWARRQQRCLVEGRRPRAADLK